MVFDDTFLSSFYTNEIFLKSKKPKHTFHNEIFGVSKYRARKFCSLLCRTSKKLFNLRGLKKFFCLPSFIVQTLTENFAKIFLGKIQRQRETTGSNPLSDIVSPELMWFYHLRMSYKT